MDKALWMARLLRRHAGMTLREIAEAWRDEDPRGKPMARSTFYDNRLRMTRFYGLETECRSGRYYLVTAATAPDPALEHLLAGSDGDAEGTDMTDCMLRAWTDLIHEATADRHCLDITYTPPGKAPYRTRLAPYCLHCVNDWSYVLGHSSHHGELRLFALDRISCMTLLPDRYRIPEGFDPATYFRDSVGAYAGPQFCKAHVVFRAVPRLAAYLRTRPLHKSQSEGPDGEFTVCVALTPDLVAQLLSFGPDLVVLQPDSLVHEVKRLLSTAAGQYEAPFPG